MKAIPTLITLSLFVSFGMLQAVPSTTKIFNGYKLEARHTDDSNYPVVGIGETTPLILTDSGVVESGKRYIKVSPAPQVNDLHLEILSVEEKKTENAIILTARVKSSSPLENAYALIVYTDEEKGQLRCKYSSIGQLSGEPEKIKLRFNSNKIPETGWTLHFFNGQRQLYTNHTKDLKDASPTQAFILHLGRHLTTVGQGDAAPNPFYMPVTKPDLSLLPDGKDPLTVRVKLTIEKSGRVETFNFEDEVNPDLKSLLSSNIREWLFFPRIEQGKLKPTTVILPIQLR